jgi:DNA-binding LytR/AlgR family response regulator
MKILIVEDEAIIAESLFQVLRNLKYTPLEPTDTSAEALEVLNLIKPDIAIVDIHLEKAFAGYKVAQKLQELNIPYIFLTALYDSETVNNASLFNPSAYLVKPFQSENIFAAIELAIRNQKRIKSTNDKQYFFKDGTEQIALYANEIVCLEALNKYVVIHTNKEKKIMVRNTLQDILLEINQQQIFQVHKSYAVNASYIISIKVDTISVGHLTVPVGRTFKDILKQKLSL